MDINSGIISGSYHPSSPINPPPPPPPSPDTTKSSYNESELMGLDMEIS